MKKLELWKRLKLMDEDDKKHLLIVLSIRLFIYVGFCLAFNNKRYVGNFEMGFVFGVVLGFIIHDMIDVFNNYIKFTDRLFNELKEAKIE